MGRSAPWRQALVHAIADYFDCVALHQRGSEDVETWGPEHLLPQVEYTFVVYLRHLREAWSAHMVALTDEGLWTQLTRRQQVDAREAFCVSFTLGVKQRLEQDRAAEVREDPRSADTATRQRKELHRWMRAHGVRWRAAPHDAGRVDGHGYKAGLEADVSAAMTGRSGPKKLRG